jgi:hypothetical protein
VFEINGPFRGKINNGSEGRIKLLLGSDNFVTSSSLETFVLSKEFSREENLLRVV